MLNSRFLLEREWLANAPVRIVRPVAGNDGLIGCAGVDVAIATIDRALAGETEDSIRSVSLVGNDWRFVSLALFNPLV